MFLIYNHQISPEHKYIIGVAKNPFQTHVRSCKCTLSMKYDNCVYYLKSNKYGNCHSKKSERYNLDLIMVRGVIYLEMS